MMLITKELAEAVIDSYIGYDNMGDYFCVHCKANNYINTAEFGEVSHDDNCIVVRAKLLLEKEWGVK